MRFAQIFSERNILHENIAITEFRRLKWSSFSQRTKFHVTNPAKNADREHCRFFGADGMGRPRFNWFRPTLSGYISCQNDPGLFVKQPDLIFEIAYPTWTG